MDLPDLKGIHFDCLEHMWDAYQGAKRAIERGESEASQ
jgi:hypothetical protein